MDVQAPIREVLVMEDRAQITRAARLSLPAGRQRLSVAGVTPLCADTTLRCRVRPLEGPRQAVRVLDVRLERRYRLRPARPEAEREIRRNLERLKDEYLAAFDGAMAQARELSLVRQAAEDLGRQVGLRVAAGAFDAGVDQALERLWSRRRELEEALLSAQFEQEDRRLAIRRLQEELRLALAPLSEYSACLVAELSADGAAETEVEWQYQVPCALWRPEYTAELVEGQPPAVRWQAAGRVWQRTGEDWNGVRLRFSTARPSQGAELPLLSDDVLRTRQKSEEERRIIQVESRDEAIAQTGTASPAERDTPPGLYDGGEERVFAVPAPVSVPSDGRPHRFEYDRFEAAAELELACCAELSPFVFLKSLQTNMSALPLLAGPVLLLRGGGTVGRSRIGYVAPSERFALSWGSEDDMVVIREREHETEETAIRHEQVHTFRTRIYLANHAAARRSLRLVERVPVSELKEVAVQIQRDQTAPGFALDDQGLCSWTVELAPGEERRLSLQFEVRHPARVRWNS